MYEIRQIIQRLRMGESTRQIARSQRVGRATVDSIHAVALDQNWLDPLGQVPEDSVLATFFTPERKAPQNVSSVEPFREEILKWHAQGINATTMRRALHQKHGYNGSVHALYRFLIRELSDTAPAMIKLEFPVGEMAQVDFGMGPVITDRKSGEIFKTWIFVCTLAWSRHQYAEVVPEFELTRCCAQLSPCALLPMKIGSPKPGHTSGLRMSATVARYRTTLITAAVTGKIDVRGQCVDNRPALASTS